MSLRVLAVSADLSQDDNNYDSSTDEDENIQNDPEIKQFLAHVAQIEEEDPSPTPKRVDTLQQIEELKQLDKNYSPLQAHRKVDIGPLRYPWQNTPMDVDASPEDDKSTLYRLHAIVVHRGSSAEYGHYVANIVDELTQEWSCFNDSVVTKVHCNLL